MKVMVIDTVGGDRFSDSYKRYFSNVHIRGIEKEDDGECHPHGYQCGYYAGVLLNAIEGDHEMVFVRVFDANGGVVKDSNIWMLDVIAKERPNIITRSWGQADHDARYGELVGQTAWSGWVRVYEKLQKEIHFVDFAAAGNDDRNDLDTDIDYPQRLMPYFSNIIGSHNRAGTPSVFSGDGHGVQCVMWGENVALNSNGRWDRGSGTSFAAPKAAGLCAALGLDHMRWNDYVRKNCTRPENWLGYLPHKKWGWGSLEHRYQEHLANVSDELHPLTISMNAHGIKMWKDFSEQEI